METQRCESYASRARKRRILGSIAIAGFLLPAVPGNAFAPFTSGGRQWRGTLSMSTTSLESLTVKELRELVKDSVVERGVLSRLKKKRDLVDYLKEHQTATASAMDEPKPLSMPPPVIQHDAPKPSRKPLSMPPPVIQHEVSSNDLSPKAAIFERVYQRYPSLRTDETNPPPSPLEDVRQLYHPIFTGTNHSSSDMDLCFVGTASCTPGITRGVSCTALRLNWRRQSALLNPETGRMEHTNANFQGGTWIFDVGECSQLQIQRSSTVKPGKITKIFLTHAHGDHSFGLPGLLCLMGQDRDRDAPPVEIYGPEGLRMWLRVAIRYSCSRIVPPHRVHEIMDVPMAPEWDWSQRTRRFYSRGRSRSGTNGGRWPAKGLAGEDSENWISQANMMQLEPNPLFGEIQGGRSIFPVYDHPKSCDGAPVWEIEDEEDVRVFAAPMSHGIPCVGYVVQELQKPGRLRNEIVEPIVRRNLDALKEAGCRIPMKAMAVIKNLPPGSAFTFPDGTVVTQEDAVEPPRDGRKVVICGDTADCRAMINLAKDADVIVHEATNAYLQGVDRDSSHREVTRDAITHGHATPQIAAEFCRAVNGKMLLLNHFSARYKGDVSVDSLSIMMRIEMQAMKASGLDETKVAASWDMMVLPILQN